MVNKSVKKHKSVMLTEVIQSLNVIEGGTYVDLTLGAGGHSWNIIQSCSHIKLICLDIDYRSVNDFVKSLIRSGFKKISENFLEDYDTHNKVYIFNENFIDVDIVLKNINIKSVNGIVADLGWSLDQLDYIEGLSYEKPEDNLDMRIDKNTELQAKHVLQFARKEKLIEVFAKFGDLENEGILFKRFINLILEYRKSHVFERVKDLLNVIGSLKIKSNNRYKDFKARVFQSLRIFVNNEIENLEAMLIKCWSFLSEMSRLCVITFHSGEQKAVENFVRNLQNKCSVELIRPSVDELKTNFSARSAKLNVITKL